jgi:hypothetical protein
MIDAILEFLKAPAPVWSVIAAFWLVVIVILANSDRANGYSQRPRDPNHEMRISDVWLVAKQ